MNKNQISAQIIADSINWTGDRCTTFVLVMPRIVLAEFNTHRAISKNSASSRAIPFHKMLEKVQQTPFIPIRWMKEHKGMQGTEYFTDESDEKELEIRWLTARNAAVEMAVALSDRGVTKQFCNRLLEPYLYHTVIATGTEWENFFALRAHDQAEIHIQDLAYKMLKEYNESTPKTLANGEYHIPFGDNLDEERIKALIASSPQVESDWHNPILEAKVKIATARCARISYNNFEGKDDYAADIKLHDSLSSSGHWSPFEHCAEAVLVGARSNLRGFRQYRKNFAGENKKDPRVLKWNN